MEKELNQGFSLESWKKVEFHEWISQDKIRNSAFKEAITDVIGGGQAVLDLGCGLGCLSYLAVKSGAAKVYGIEYCQNIITTAKNKFNIYGKYFSEKIKFICNHSLNVGKNVIEPVDVIVSETLGFMGIGENIVKNVADARKKWLKPGGKIIPEEIELYLAPVFLPNRQNLTSSQVMVKVKPEYLAGNPVCFAKFDLYSDDEVFINKKLHFETNEMKVNGFAGWFKAKLSENVILDTSSYKPTTCWFQMFYPLDSPIIKKNITVQVSSYEKNNLVFLKIDLL